MPYRLPPPRPVAPPPRAMPIPPPTRPQFIPPPGPQTPVWYPQPTPYPQRPKSSTAKLVTVTLVSVLVVTGALVGLLAATSEKKSTSVADSGYNSYPSTTPTSGPFTTTSRATPTTTTTTTSTTRTTTPPSTTTPTRTTSQAPRGPQPVYRTKDNPLFSGTNNGTNTVTCTLPRWKSDPQSTANFFTAALPCLEAAWSPALQRANLPYARPNLAFPAGTTWQSPCGTITKADAPAFYCPANSTLYMPFAGLYTETIGNRPGRYLALFAHEFGHHVQALSGSFRAAHQEMYDLGPDTAAGLEMSRRIELQAQCLGGMFFAAAWNGKGSIDDNIIREMLADGYDRGDENARDGKRDHGSKRNSGGWQEHGYKNNRTYQCNTYLSPAAHVS